MNEVIARNIHTLLDKRQSEERQAGFEQRLADAITRFSGSMPFVYLHAVFFGCWIVVNLGWVAWTGVRPFDPSFVVLAMIASVEAIFLSTFVMIGQNRQSEFQQAKADHDFTEQELELKTNTELTREIDKLTSELHKRLIDDQPEQQHRLHTHQSR